MITNRFLQHRAVSFPMSTGTMQQDPSGNIFQQLPIHSQTSTVFEIRRHAPKPTNVPTKYAKTGNVTGIRHRGLTT